MNQKNKVSESSQKSIEQFLETLLVEEKIILKSYYLGGKSCAEIAELLKVPIDVIERIVKNGKIKLLTIFSNE